MGLTGAAITELTAIVACLALTAQLPPARSLLKSEQQTTPFGDLNNEGGGRRCAGLGAPPPGSAQSARGLRSWKGWKRPERTCMGGTRLGWAFWPFRGLQGVAEGARAKLGCCTVAERGLAHIE